MENTTNVMKLMLLFAFLMCILASLAFALGLSFWSIFLVVPLVYALYCLIEYPEISFALFLTAGVYKADPRVSSIQNLVDLTVLFGVVSLAGVLYHCFLKKDTKLIRPPLEMSLPYLSILLWAFFSLSYTLSPIYGSYKLIRFSTITLLAYFLPLYLFQETKAVDRFFETFVIIGLAMFFDIVTGGLKPDQIVFASAFDSNYLAVGRICGSCILILFSYFLPKSRSVAGRLLCISALVALIFAVFVSGSRGPVIATFAALFSVLLYEIVRGFVQASSTFRIKKVDLLQLGNGFFLASLAAIVFAVFREYFTTFISRFALLVNGLGTSALERLSMYSAAVKAMQSFPTGLIGLGIGGFQVYYNGYDGARGYPHNIFLEIGAELGVIGLFFFILLLAFAVRKLLRSSNSSRNLNRYFLVITLLALFINMFVNACVSGDLNDNRLLFTWIGMIFSSGGFLAANG